MAVDSFRIDDVPPPVGNIEKRRKRAEECRQEREQELELARIEARRKTENVSKIRVARHKQEKVARLRTEEEERPKVEEETRLKAEKETRLKAEKQTRLKAKEEAGLKAEEEGRTMEEERKMDEGSFGRRNEFEERKMACGRADTSEKKQVDVIKDKAKDDLNPANHSKKQVDLNDDELKKKSQNYLRENSKD
ncbi:hypothetical protein TNCV_2432501 [Trichonephila clavipes]|nr:hypothetical protein TNCV_2432501 [Trichonephila clavipes]